MFPVSVGNLHLTPSFLAEHGRRPIGYLLLPMKKCFRKVRPTSGTAAKLFQIILWGLNTPDANFAAVNVVAGRCWCGIRMIKPHRGAKPLSGLWDCLRQATGRQSGLAFLI